VRLLKGAEVAAFCLKDRMSQGEREWLDEGRYQKKYKPHPNADLRRIATQRITGVDERWRIVAAPVEPRAYFADSTNSIVVAKDCKLSLELVLGILNSRLMQWRFKLTSSNNNVGTNELEMLPLRIPQSAGDERACGQIENLVRQAMKAAPLACEADSEAERNRTKTLLETCRRQIDTLIYRLYSLTDQEAQWVERMTSAGLGRE
jgi:TaqI-like C-terminal specificity domain